MNFPQNKMINEKDGLEENRKKLGDYCRFLQIKKWDREDIIQETYGNIK
ncbi:hypothetical protein [Niallia nealsonii]|nr:hypothetical protein [Niallia nealsonii]